MNLRLRLYLLGEGQRGGATVVAQGIINRLPKDLKTWNLQRLNSGGSVLDIFALDTQYRVNKNILAEVVDGTKLVGVQIPVGNNRKSAEQVASAKVCNLRHDVKDSCEDLAVTMKMVFEVLPWPPSHLDWQDSDKLDFLFKKTEDLLCELSAFPVIGLNMRAGERLVCLLSACTCVYVCVWCLDITYV